MTFLAEQFSDYPRVHTTRANLLIHIVAVPVFDLAVVGAVASLATRSWIAVAGGAVVAVAAFAVEGRGHALEPEAPIPSLGRVTSSRGSSPSSSSPFRASYSAALGGRPTVRRQGAAAAARRSLGRWRLPGGRLLQALSDPLVKGQKGLPTDPAVTRSVYASTLRKAVVAACKWNVGLFGPEQRQASAP